MGSDQRKYVYEAVPGFFAQELPDTDPITFDYSAHNLGLLDQAYEIDGVDDGAKSTQWQRLMKHIDHLGSSAPSGTSYKLIINGRHGEGHHNVAEALHGTEAWDEYWSKLDGDGAVRWVDSRLTEVGRQQALGANWCLRHQFEVEKMPAPERYYVSPLYRCLQTAQLTYSGLDLPKDRPFTPLVKEMLREVMGEHTCDRRSSRAVIHEAFPDWPIEQGFREDDVLWQVDHRETHAEHDVRTLALLDDVFQHDSSTVVSFTSHSGSIASLLRVLGHREFKLQTGALIPLVVKATRVV